MASKANLKKQSQSTDLTIILKAPISEQNSTGNQNSTDTANQSSPSILRNNSHHKTQPQVPITSPQAHKTQPQIEITQPQAQITQPQTEITQPQAQTTQPHEQITQPQIQTTQPHEQITQPQVQTTQPHEQITQPQVQTTQPHEQITQPQVQTTQPHEQITQPQVQTTQPHEQTTQPQVQTTQPQVQTTQPQVQTTQPHVQTTQPQVQTTQSQVQTTPSQAQTTQPQAQTTQPQLQITQPQAKTTQPQGQTTQPQAQQKTHINARQDYRQKQTNHPYAMHNRVQPIMTNNEPPFSNTQIRQRNDHPPPNTQIKQKNKPPNLTLPTTNNNNNTNNKLNNKPKIFIPDSSFITLPETEQAVDPIARTRPKNRRPPPIGINPGGKRISMIYTREELQLMVQLRAESTQESDLPEEHKEAMKKFLADKASILHHGDMQIHDLKRIKDLGFGNSGNVSKKAHIHTNVVMACKTIKLEVKEAQRTAILSELHVLHDCSSPYIVGFFGSFSHNMNLEICMEFMDGGSLDQVIRTWGRIPEDVVGLINKSVIMGLVYLIKKINIIHRDVKPSNILINTRGEVKLCDFGVSKQLLDTRGMANSFVGTRSYMAPERLQGSEYSVSSDIWSLGISLIEMALGMYPIPPPSEAAISAAMALPPAGSEYQEPPASQKLDHPMMAPFEVLQYVVMEAPPLLPRKYFSQDFCEFVEMCLEKNPDKRPNLLELMELQFVINADNNHAKVDLAAWVCKIAVISD